MTDIITTKLNKNSEFNPIVNNSKKRVLVIEDNGEIRLMLKSLMVAIGYIDIDVESSGQRAIKLILEKPYDVVLCDYNLNGSIDGQQILEITRKHYALDHSTIFIMITADTDYANVVSILEYQPDSYLVKPFPPAVFYRRFNRVQQQKKVFDNVNIARKEQSFAEMENQAKVIMAKSPHYSNVCLKTIGESLFLRGKYKAAKDHYLQIIEKNSNLAWAHFGIAECELKRGHLEPAIARLETTIALSRHYLSAYDALADAQERLGNRQAAQAAMIGVLDVSPSSIERSRRLAQISIEIEDWQVAEQAYSRIIRLTKDSNQEKIEHYYDYLKCLTNMIEHGYHDAKIAVKFNRYLMRLRELGKEKPIVVSNSFRVEVQQYLSRDYIDEAIKSWKSWSQLIESGHASPITEAQELSIKKRLGLL